MKIFLSYAEEADDNDARTLALFLRAKGHNVWYEVGGISGGLNWQQETKTIIEGSDWFIALISPDYVNSQPVRWELSTALQANIAVLPVFIRKTNLQPTSLSYLQNFNTIDATADFQQGIRDIVDYLDNQEQAAHIEQIAPIISQFAANIQSVLDAPSPDRIFIAYSRKQRTIAQSLYEILIKHGKAVFWDAKIKAGAVWRQTIQKALDDATHVIVIWTPDAAESDEVEREVSYALAERKVIVPLLSKEIPRLPYHLHGLHYIILEDDLGHIEKPLLTAIEQFADSEDIWH